MTDAEENFEGHDGRECGEHRTTGSRAWCFDCSEWCYPEEPCKGCELPKLRARLERLEKALREYGRHSHGCSADHDEAKYVCRCGWIEERAILEEGHDAQQEL
jgi:hypothetical protein